MPGIPLVTRETKYIRNLEQMRHRNNAPDELSQEEQIAAEETLSAYCRPVELYNIIQRRAEEDQPLFLQRCLHYKLREKRKRRIQISVSVSGSIYDGMHTQSLFPLFILLGRRVANANAETRLWAVYRFRRACRLTAFNDAGTVSSAQAILNLPEITKLSAVVESGSFDILLVTSADITNSQGIDLTNDNVFSDSSNVEGYCLLGKIPMNALHLAWEGSSILSLGETAETMSTVSMQSCFMKLNCSDGEKSVSFQYPENIDTESVLQQVPVIISIEERGAKDRSIYQMYSNSDIPTESLINIARLRFGNVTFNYKYYNNRMQKTEVTEDFTCPFCLVRCASFEGLRCHLIATHDLFRYEFWVNEDYQVINVFVRTAEGRSEVVAYNVDPKQHPFEFFCNSMRRKGPRSPTQNANHGSPILLDLGTPEHSQRDTCSSRVAAAGAPGPSLAESGAPGPSLAESGSAHLVPGSDLAPPAMLRFARTRKLPAERFDPRGRLLLKKQQFFHSHRAQPMELEQVLAAQDSEDEIDDDVADLEDQRMLDDFVDVTDDEKQLMRLWNSFARRQRVLADGHIPWACEAFSKLHGEDLVKSPGVLWTWRLFMIKLWNQDLLDARTMDNCNLILGRIQKQSQSQGAVPLRM